MHQLSRRAALRLALSSTLFPHAFAHAQAWPDRPIRLIVPFPAGSVTDVVARAIGKVLGENVGQPVVVENRVGASGIIGTELVAKAAPNGLTLLLGSISTHALNPWFYSRLPYDAEKSFVPISEVALTPNVVVISAASPVHTMRDFIAATKAGTVHYATAGVGSGPHLCGELMKSLGAIQMSAVPYKGAPECFTAVVSGEVQMTIQSITSALPLIRGGRLRAIGVTSRQRSPVLPEVPALSEAGFPGYEFSSWSGVFAPAGTPADVVAKLHAEIVKAARSEEVQRSITTQGGVVVANSPEQFAAVVKAELAKWGKVIRDANIKVE
ncbi:MAG TPA: tripartite tricarboxylate transporter substrate binding protein [Ramlibacter sp.]|nr:tripartite tricarboxylate transporter substrate binding protein [Ramlibacter sp.]